jgi:hypothetical protein
MVLRVFRVASRETSPSIFGGAKFICPSFGVLALNHSASVFPGKNIAIMGMAARQRPNRFRISLRENSPSISLPPSNLFETEGFEAVRLSISWQFTTFRILVTIKK